MSETMTKERPVLLNGDEVRGIVDRQQTQLRRVVKDMPPFIQHTPDVNAQVRDAPYFDAYCGERKTAVNPRGMSDRWCWWTRDNRQGPGWVRCPYGAVGDRLWVRETWASLVFERDHESGYIDGWHEAPNPKDGARVYSAHADGFNDNGNTVEARGFAWRPSVSMPRWASRLTLEIVRVRVERVQDISEADARAEGCEGYRVSDGYDIDPTHDVDPVEEFRDLWNARNAKRGSGWDVNPWVWVLDFTRVEG